MEMINEALKRRKGRNVDIAIVLGGDGALNMEEPQSLGEGEEDESAEQEKLGLAPEAKDEGEDVHEDAEADKALIMEMLGKKSLLSRGK